MKKKEMTALLAGLLLLPALSCGGNSKKGDTDGGYGPDREKEVEVPSFNEDSAYQYIKDQIGFGYRIPDTEPHAACGDYLAGRLAAAGAQVTNQYADVTAYDGTLLKVRNIIGAFKPESKKRIALFAHWDTRPWADNDPDGRNHHTPVTGADDGASGVGVLLEIARQIGRQAPELGIDILFLDAEDYGTPQFHEGEHREDTWCLGAQCWARTPHVERYNARFGILLDMVGGRGSVFMKEGYSEEFAPDINKKIWKAARKLGYGKTFAEEKGGFVTDDHLFINRIARIQTADIIPSDPEGSFTPTWHTVDDTLAHIDTHTLKAVGQTVLTVIYNER